MHRFTAFPFADVNRGDAERQRLATARRRSPRRASGAASSGSDGKVRHGPRQVAVRGAVAADQAADERQHVVEVEVVAARARPPTRGVVNSRITNRAPGASTRCTSRSAGIERRDVADAERDDRAVHAMPSRERQLAARRPPPARATSRGALPDPGAQHRLGEVGADHDEPAEPGLPAQRRAHVQRARAQIEVRARPARASTPSAAIARRRQRRRC